MLFTSPVGIGIAIHDARGQVVVSLLPVDECVIDGVGKIAKEVEEGIFMLR